MSTEAQVDIPAVINDLLQAEQSGALHFLSHGSPYIGRRVGPLRRPLQQIISGTLRREAELAALLDQLSVTPRPGRPFVAHQHLAFMAVEYLLPKLLAEKDASIARYQAALPKVVGHPMSESVLRVHLQEHQNERATLADAMAKLAPKTSA